MAHRSCVVCRRFGHYRLRRRDTINDYDNDINYKLDATRRAIDHNDYRGTLHVHDELNGPGILIHDDDCADHEFVYVRPDIALESTTYGPRSPHRSSHRDGTDK